MSYRIPATVMNLHRVAIAIDRSGLTDAELSSLTGVPAALVAKIRAETATRQDVTRNAYDRLREYLNSDLAVALRKRAQA